uniref:Ycf20 n=1 Tax=Callipsygma wilsonis TaxID=2320807 RepID=A0A386B008_9CHLO|nr:hypothetical protein Ycf20 [Callipsygma wilsonis]AYC65030.1 hypothetical protein Ycf20 [Callipsygma wilsonis]
MFLKYVCTFYLSFIFGSLFGTFLIFFRKNIIWDGIILFLLILNFEYLNFLIYRKKKYIKIFKNIQIGLLIGFFIDAFKVGS